MSSTDFSDLLQSAEQLSADCLLPYAPSGDGNAASAPALGLGPVSDLPRVQRNLAQLVEAGQQLYRKTSRQDGSGSSQEAKAALLLGARGVDLPALGQKLNALQRGSNAEFAPLEPLRDTDIAGFLRNERENAILSVIAGSRRIRCCFKPRVSQRRSGY